MSIRYDQSIRLLQTHAFTTKTSHSMNDGRQRKEEKESSLQTLLAFLSSWSL